MNSNKIDKYDMQTADYNKKARQKLQDLFDDHVHDEMHHSECLTELMKSDPCIIILSDADYRLINQLETN